jgi:hypothetical protein
MLGFPDMLDYFYIHDTGDTHAAELAYQFLHASEKIAPWLADFIYARLLEYPERNVIRINPGAVSTGF